MQSYSNLYDNINTFNPLPIIPSIQQIYQIDTITLQQQIQYVQQLQRNKQKNIHINIRMVNNFLALAKIELEERKKIEQFAMKLVLEQYNQYQQKEEFKFNYRNDNKRFCKIQQKQKQIQKQDINIKNISIKLPRISSTNKIIHNKQIIHNNINNDNKIVQQINNKINTITTKYSNQFNEQKQTPINNSKNNKCGLNKKQFLQMMRIKLAQSGTQTYKVGKSTLQSSSNKIITNNNNRSNINIQNNKSVKLLQKTHNNIKNNNNNNTNYKTQRNINNDKNNKNETVYIQSSLIIGQHQQNNQMIQNNNNNIMNKFNRSKSNINIKTIKKESNINSKQYDQQSRLRINSVMNSSKSTIQKKKYKEDKQQSNCKNNKDITNKTINNKDIHNNNKINKRIQIQNLLQKQSNDYNQSSQQQISSKQQISLISIQSMPNLQKISLQVQNIKKQQNNNKKQNNHKIQLIQSLFKQNNDIYDDQPWKFQKQIMLVEVQQQNQFKQVKQVKQQKQQVQSIYLEVQQIIKKEEETIQNQNNQINQIKIIESKEINQLNQNLLSSKQSYQHQIIQIDRKDSDISKNQFNQQTDKINQHVVEVNQKLIFDDKSKNIVDNKNNINKSIQNPTPKVVKNNNLNTKKSSKGVPNILTSTSSSSFLTRRSSSTIRPISSLVQNQYNLIFQHYSFSRLFNFCNYSLHFNPLSIHQSNNNQSSNSIAFNNNNNNNILAKPTSHINNQTNYLNILKSLQLSLINFFNKNTLKQAINLQRQMNKIYQNQAYHNNKQNVQIKTYTQLQLIRKYKHLFDLNNLEQKFYQKSMKNLQRVRRLNNNQNNNKNNNFKIQDQDYMFYRVIKTKQQVYDIVTSTFNRSSQQWLQLPHGCQLQSCWNLLWTWSKPQINFNTLFIFQKVNHFVNSKQLARKDLLKKNIEKIKKLSKKLNDYFDIIPQTFFLPGQNQLFIKKFKQCQLKSKPGNNLWILKPVGLSRGRGIQLINKLQSIKFSQPIVMQKYITNPLLLNGYKFDLRIYILVTSMNPLQCFIYRQGFARVSTQKYSTSNDQQINNKFIHLTNYSVQKQNMQMPDIFTQCEKQLGGCKLTLRMLKQKLSSMGISQDKYKFIIWPQIQQLVLKSLIACMKYIPHNPNCFQLFGYDIMIDSQLKCWLIQVNSSPSLQMDFFIDQVIKQQMMDDLIEIVLPVKFNRKQLLSIITRRKKQIQGLKSNLNFMNNSIEMFNQDIKRILKNKKIRKYGQITYADINNGFKCIAPGDQYDKILKIIQPFTLDKFVRSNNLYC